MTQSSFTCGNCTHNKAWPLIDLGTMPSANSLLKSASSIAHETKFPLRAVVCAKCNLVQLDHVVSPDELFSDYVYFSSHSKGWLEHARKYAEAAIERYSLGPNSMVVEVASNDGYLLRNFVDAGIPALGVEPAENVARTARDAGVPTTARFFNRETAEDLVKQGYAADLMAANNVLAHVPDINSFIGGFATLLKPDGRVSFEFPHLLRMLEGRQFDTIYHEHFYYLSLGVVEGVMAQHGLTVFDVEEIETHGGSLRVWAHRADGPTIQPEPSVAKVRNDEAAAALDREETYRDWTVVCERVRDDLREFLDQAKAESKSIVGYGAAAKGSTMLNYCGATDEDVTHVADLNPTKQGCLMPGSHIPIIDPKAVNDLKPDYLLILPWNISEEIMTSMSQVRDWGCQFVIPSPELKIVP